MAEQALVQVRVDSDLKKRFRIFMKRLVWICRQR